MLHELVTGSEVCLPQATEGESKVSEAVLRRVVENSERSQDFDVLSLRFTATIPVVYQEHSSQLGGERNCLSLPRAEDLGETFNWLAWSFNGEPRGRVGKPRPNHLGRPLLAELSQDSGWHHQPAVQTRQNMNMLDEEQIMQWACIGDDDHLGRRSRSRSAASSACRSSIKRALVAPSRSKSSTVYSSGTPWCFRNPSSS